MANHTRRSLFVLFVISFVLATQVPLFCEWHFWEVLTVDGTGGYGGYSCDYENLYTAFFSLWSEPTIGIIALNIALLFLYTSLVFGLIHLLIRFARRLRGSKSRKR